MGVSRRNGKDGMWTESSFERQRAWGLTEKIHSILSVSFLPLCSTFHVLPQRRRSRSYLTGRSIFVDNVITTFRRSEELSGTTIGPRYKRRRKFAFLPATVTGWPAKCENTTAESNKVFRGRRMRGDDTFVECRNKSAYRVSA